MSTHKFKNFIPVIADEVFIAHNATIIGDVSIKKHSSVWFNCVLRGDINSIIIGEGTNIQDACVLHVTDFDKVIIGDFTTLGHKVLAHGATIGSNCLIGMGATLLDGVVISDNCFIAANSLITPKTVIPPNSFVLGSPAKVIRQIKPQEISYISENVKSYIDLSLDYIKSFK